MPDPERFSVVIPAFDREGTLEGTVRSVLAAADRRAADGDGPSEVVVVDDGSSDATLALARRLAADDPRVRVLHQGNAGAAAARNLGARTATGRWLAFLDCDDVVDPSWLLDFGRALAAGARLVFAPARATAAGGPRPSPWRPHALGPAFGGITGLFNPGMFAVARADVDAVGAYAVALTFSENTELGLRLTAHLEASGALDVAVIDHPLVTVSVPPGGSNAANPTARLQSALYLLDVHRDRLALDPALHARYWSIAGVAAARLGDAALARRCFATATRTDPRSPVHAARALAASVPPVRNRRWPVSPPATASA